MFPPVDTVDTVVTVLDLRGTLVEDEAQISAAEEICGLVYRLSR